MNDCGCDLFICAPYLQSKFTNLSVKSTVMSDDTLPAWVEVKVKKRLSFIPLLVYLILGHIVAGIFLLSWFRVSYL